MPIRLFLASLGLALLPLAAGCTGEPVSGLVLHKDTGEPIRGAFVMATWTAGGSDGYGSRSSCLDVQVTRTDAAGRFELRPEVFGPAPSTKVFMPGLEEDGWSPVGGIQTIFMRPFTGTVEQRRDFYQAFWRLDCGGMRAIEKLRELYAEIDRESDSLGPRPAFGGASFAQAIKGYEELHRENQMKRR